MTIVILNSCSYYNKNVLIVSEFSPNIVMKGIYRIGAETGIMLNNYPINSW